MPRSARGRTTSHETASRNVPSKRAQGSAPRPSFPAHSRSNSTLNERMPWKEMEGMTDGEIEALWNYLRSTGNANSSGS